MRLKVTVAAALGVKSMRAVLGLEVSASWMPPVTDPEPAPWKTACC